MLELYIKSVIIYYIIFIATTKLGKFITKNRTDINYKNYSKEVKGKVSQLVIAFIPIIRTIYFITMLIIIFGSKETLDNIFKKEAEQQIYKRK